MVQDWEMLEHLWKDMLEQEMDVQNTEAMSVSMSSVLDTLRVFIWSVGTSGVGSGVAHCDCC